MKEGMGKSKKGQITIFVIIALVIIVFGALVYLFYPGLRSTTVGVEENPRIYLQNCVEQTLSENIELISSQGGSTEPPSSFVYNGVPVEYLCYNEEPYENCIPQRALLINHIEDEIKTSIEEKLDSCFNEMAEDYEGNGYDVTLNNGDFEVILAPNRILLISKTRLQLSKDSIQNYESFDIILNNNLFELASIARGIIIWEKTYGDSDPVYFMSFYPHIKVEKKPMIEGIKIYIITDRETEDEFQFAVRAEVNPLGIKQ